MKSVLKQVISYTHSRLRSLVEENERLRAEIERLKNAQPTVQGVIMRNGPDWPISYNADGFATMHNADFIKEPAFQRAYRLGLNTGHRWGTDIHIEWRVFVTCWAASHATKLEGDFVDCGVNTGVSSRAVVDYVNFAAMPERTYFLLDTYAGVPLDQLIEAEKGLGIEEQNTHYFDCYSIVCATFAPFPNVRIVRGRVPATLPQITSNKIAYVSIDMNSVVPEIAAGEYLWPRLVPGAIIVLDDYGWRPHINQKHAWDKFAAERGVKVLALPTGQGLLLKP